MIAVIFELAPHAGQASRYVELARALSESLRNMPGFISVERFESIQQPGHLLSLSFWQDEASVRAWRRLAAHRQAQTHGRSQLFSHYRLRVAHVVRDYGLHERGQAPDDAHDKGPHEHTEEAPPGTV